MENRRILVVDDDPGMCDIVTETVSLSGAQAQTAHSVSQARELAEKQHFDVVVTDLSMPGEDGMVLVRHLKKRAPLTSVIIITAYPDKDRVKISEEYEVCSFLTKPFTVEQLQFAVFRALEKNRALKQKAQALADVEEHSDLGLIGKSDYIQGMRRQIAQTAGADYPVIIQGDSGTGKDIIAHAIHNCSARRNERIIIVNCAAIPQHLEEAEFFGHTRGAFTGAAYAREGIIAAADRSTLFLDEVGELSMGTQAKLLRVIENKEYARIGENVPRKADIRIISATNKDLRRAVDEGLFREDLYYRLCGKLINTMPLRSHSEDIPVLMQHFISMKCDEGRALHITADALEYLVKQRWLGNIRELKHFAAIVYHHAQQTASRSINTAVIESAIHESIPENDSTKAYLRDTYSEAKAKVISNFEHEYFTKLLRKFSGNLSRASKEAGMDRSNLIKKLKAAGISADEFR